MKYMMMCGNVRIKIIPVNNIGDADMSSTAYKEVRKLATDMFGLLDCVIENLKNCPAGPLQFCQSLLHGTAVFLMKILI